jgi:transaldolase/glucose-6-phosphate isomerase
MSGLGPTLHFADPKGLVVNAIESATAVDLVRRIWSADPSVWSDDRATQALVKQRLGWLHVAEEMHAALPEVAAWARQVRSGISHVVLLGMGGSSLAPEVMEAVLPRGAGSPQFVVLDSTDPSALQRVGDCIELARTMFVVASKSGDTLETQALAAYFWSRCRSAGIDEPGRNFVAITDAGSSLAQLGVERSYARVFENPDDIGGRYSALSFFGLVPAMLAGLDVDVMLGRTVKRMRQLCTQPVAANNNPMMIGAAVAVLAREGRDKFTILAESGLEAIGSWVEQLVAESTGKDGVGMVPVDGETFGGLAAYDNDRVFVHLVYQGTSGRLDSEMDLLVAAGHPVIKFVLEDPPDLGAHFFDWQLMIAAVGYGLGVNPFDEPNVSESKANTLRVLQEGSSKANVIGVDTVTVDEGCSAFARTLDVSLRRWIASIRKGDYLSIQAYVDRTTVHDAPLRSIQALLRDRTRRAVTVGYGPRLLHSTGQLHKGGANDGVFLQITTGYRDDIMVPESTYSFGGVIEAQAAGDRESLFTKGRRCLHLHVPDPHQGLRTILEAFTVILGRPAEDGSL